MITKITLTYPTLGNSFEGNEFNPQYDKLQNARTESSRVIALIAKRQAFLDKLQPHLPNISKDDLVTLMMDWWGASGYSVRHISKTRRVYDGPLIYIHEEDK